MLPAAVGSVLPSGILQVKIPDDVQHQLESLSADWSKFSFVGNFVGNGV